LGEEAPLFGDVSWFKGEIIVFILFHASKGMGREIEQSNENNESGQRGKS
jgi:hypothetical protein